jgi:hypothetical protein
MVVSAKNDYSFKRFNRRFIYQGIYLPTLYSEEIGELVVNKGYKSHYDIRSFDDIVSRRQGQ